MGSQTSTEAPGAESSASRASSSDGAASPLPARLPPALRASNSGFGQLISIPSAEIIVMPLTDAAGAPPPYAGGLRTRPHLCALNAPLSPAGKLPDGMQRSDTYDFALSARRSYGNLSEAGSDASSAFSLKRTFSQSSIGQSSSIRNSGTNTPLVPADHDSDFAAVRVSRSGTWPLRRQRPAAETHGASQEQLGNQLDLWEMQDSLQREKVQLAEQLAQLTGLTGVGTSFGARAVLTQEPAYRQAADIKQAARDRLYCPSSGSLQPDRGSSPTSGRPSFVDESARNEQWMDDLKQLVEQVAEAPEEEDDDYMLEKILTVLQHGGDEGAGAAIEPAPCHAYRSALAYPFDGGSSGGVKAGSVPWGRPLMADSAAACPPAEYEYRYPSPVAVTPVENEGYYGGYSNAPTTPVAPYSGIQVLYPRSGPNLKPGTACVCGMNGLKRGMITT